MNRKTSRDVEIERRIVERDRLLSGSHGVVGRAAPPSTPVGDARVETQLRLLREGLARFLDEEWVRHATPEELAAHARAVLASAERAPHAPVERRTGRRVAATAPSAMPPTAARAEGER